MDAKAKPVFVSGQVIRHKRHGYRGVIVSVDDTFQGKEEWYDKIKNNKAPKDRPWYHVLVDNSQYETYVSESNLTSDLTGEPIDHPLVSVFWDDLEDGYYSRDHRLMN
jgi:heat shock protein HspQ